MLRYETLILSPTQITDDEVSMLENYFEKLASEGKGKVISFDKWGKYRLAYPVKNNDYGIYILVRYELPQEIVTKTFNELKDFFKIKCSEIVMRYVTNKLDSAASLEYRYPEPIDGGRSSNLDSFIKENKMETFLNSDVKKNSEEEAPVEKVEEESSPASEEDVNA